MPDTATLNGSTPGTDDLIASVRTESRSLTLRELLNETPRVLLGVTTDAVSVLSQIEVDTVFDLATSSVFDDAAKLVKASSAFDSPLSQHGAPSADVVREGLVAGKPVGELQFMSIGILEKIPQNVVADLKSALDVETVRDLAFYPPYRAAVRLMNAVYFPDNVAGIDLEQPRDLLPRTGEYPTERVQYATLLLDEIPTGDGEELIDVTGLGFLPIDIEVLAKADAGFKKSAFGALLTFNQSWYAQGVTLGQLLHSTSLAPGESTRVAIIDWTRRSRAGETEIIDETDDLQNDQSHNRSISEVTKAVANEAQGGFSSSNTNSHSSQTGVSAAAEISAPLGGLLGGPSGSMGMSHSEASSNAHADSYSTSWGNRNVATSMNQAINDRTHQHAHSNRSRRASVVKEVSQTEHEAVSTRVLANYNHMHALTVQYYEVVQVYRIEVRVMRADRVVFIPVALLDFGKDEIVRRFQGVLGRAALTFDIRQALQNLDVIEITPDLNTHYTGIAGSVSKFALEALAQPVRRASPIASRNLRAGAFGELSAVSADIVADAATPAAAAATPTAAAAVSIPTAALAEAFSPKVVSPVVTASITQHLSDRLWSGDQAARLSGLLNISVLRRAASSMFLPTDVSVEGGWVEADGAALQIVFHDINGNIVGGIDADSPSPMTQIGRIGVKGSSAERDVDATVTLTLNRNGVRFPLELPTVRVAKGTAGETKVVALKPGGVNVNLKQHLTDNRMHYSQAVFRSLDATQIALLLSGYGVTINGETVPVAQVVEPLPIRYVGNYLAFKMNTDVASDETWAKWLDERGIKIGASREDIVPLGSGGTFAEAVLGRSNAAEKLDITRFWNWQDSPIPLQPSDIAAIQTGSRAMAEDTSPGQLSNPIINITSPTSLPDPTGTAAILSAIQNGNMFRDMSGLQATVGLAQAALQATAAGASTAGEQAGTNMNNLLKANTERQRIAAEMITSLAQTAASAYTGGAVKPGGGVKGGGGSHSEDGAKINYFDKNAAPASGGGTSSGAGGGGAPASGGGGHSGGGGNGTGPSTNGTGGGGPRSEAPAYSENPAALAATWGDTQSPSNFVNGLVDKASDVIGESAGPGGGAIAGNAGVTHAFDAYWPDAELFNQTTNDNCWATAAAMVASWDRRQSVAIMDTPDPADLDEVATRFDLEVEPPVSYSIDAFRQILESTGPQWVSAEQPFQVSPSFHAVVIAGMYSDGNPDGSGTYLYVLDPWDRGHGSAGKPGPHLGTHAVGSRYTISWRQFMEELENAVIVEPGWMWVRLMHASNASGRHASAGASRAPIT